MSERVTVKTKTAAEKAIKAGKPILIMASISLVVAVDADIHVGGNFQPTVVARESSQPRVEAWNSSQPRVVAWGNSQPTVVAWGNSQPYVVARESSRPTIEAWENSRPTVEALENSQPRVEARGFSMLQLKGASIAATASATATINLWGGSKCNGGRQQNCEISTPEQWCEYQGVPIDDGKVVLFKAVDDNYQSEHGGDYTPGSITKAHEWNTTTECGAGLHASPSPRHTHEFVKNPKRYVAVTADVADLVFFWDGDYPNKVKFPQTVAPAYEVDIDGNPVAARVA